MTNTTHLQKLLQDAKADKQLSNRKIAEVASQNGYPLTHGTVSNVIRGRFERPTERVLAGLATALGLPLDELLEAANYSARIGEYTPPSQADRLTLEQRRAVDRMIVLYVEKNDELEALGRAVLEDHLAHPEQGELDLAADSEHGLAPGQTEDRA